MMISRLRGVQSLIIRLSKTMLACGKKILGGQKVSCGFCK